MNQNSIQSKRPTIVKLVVLWHWTIVVAIAWVALHCQFSSIGSSQFWLGAGLFGWAIWAAKTVIAFSQDQDAALLSMRWVHRSVKYTAGFGAIGSPLIALFLLTQSRGGMAAALIAVGIMPIVAFCCLVVFVISHRVTRTLDELGINS